MAVTDDGDSDTVTLLCTNPNLIEPPENTNLAEISVSTAEISSWDLSNILNHPIIKVQVNRTRLIDQSSYFQSLLSGNFSESSMHCVSIQWNLEMFLHILRFIHGCHLEVTFCNFLPLYHAAVYFGLERLISECKTWLYNSMSKAEHSSSQLQLADLLRIWEFGFEYAIDWIVGLCTSFVAKNFMWALSSDAFADLPFDFLVSCVKHPQLTVDSERHLCEALLAWVSANIELPEQTSSAKDVRSDNSQKASIITKDDWTRILKEIRVCLLPLGFTLGKCRCCYFSGFAKQGIVATSALLKGASKDYYMEKASDSSYMRIRLTEYSKKLDLSGCPQVTSAVLLLSVLPESSFVGPLLLEDILNTSIDLEHPKWLSHLPTLSFEAMLEVDISMCSRLHLGAAIECFRKSFPFLKIIRMSHFLDFETKKLCQLIEKCPSVSEVDLTVDISPLSSSNVSVLYSGSLTKRELKSYFDLSSCHRTQRTVSNITKLSLEGRTDFSDPELHKIAELCVSLCYLNIRGCLRVTDEAIANLLSRCRKLHSIIATDTSFGRYSISALCSRSQDTKNSRVREMGNNHLKGSGISLQMLHIGGCQGVSDTSLVEILSQEPMLKSLCLRDTCLTDQALYSFSGSNLEMLDVSNTMISSAALSHTIAKNPGLKYLEMRGCQNLDQHRSKHKDGHLASPHHCEELFRVLGAECKLVGLVTGWGFSFSTVAAAGPALKSLKAINIGLGGSLGPEGLIMLYALSPFLESITLMFQVISDTVIAESMKTLRNLEALSVGYCIGDISPLSLQHSVPTLRKLKLERVTPWMTNHDLSLLTQNCANLIELSLVGCRYLDVDSQQIISSGWPGLIYLHLEDCGTVTSHGVSFLLDCKAMEDLLLRHNGPGLQRSFILDAASKLPMLRSLSLDWCDAIDDEFDLPHMQASKVYIRLPEYGGSEEASAQRDSTTCVEQYQPPEGSRQRENYVMNSHVVNEFNIHMGKELAPIHASILPWLIKEPQ